MFGANEKPNKKRNGKPFKKNPPFLTKLLLLNTKTHACGRVGWYKKIVKIERRKNTMKELIEALEKFLQKKNFTWDDIEVIMEHSDIYNEEEEYYDDDWYEYIGENVIVRDYKLSNSSLTFRILITEYYNRGHMEDWEMDTSFKSWEYNKDILKHYIEQLKKREVA